MLIPYKKDYEKIAMGLLSYLPDYKNLINLQAEMSLIQKDNEFHLYLYRDNKNNVMGIIGTQETDKFVVIRYISLAPGYRDEMVAKEMVIELKQTHLDKQLSALPEYTYLLKMLG